MRLLFLTQWFHPEPGAIRGLPLARELHKSGDQVEVLTGFPNYPGGKIYPGYRLRPYQREEIDGIRVVRVPLYPSHDASAVGRAANYLSFALSAATLGTALVHRADVGYVYHPPPTVGLPAAVLRRIRSLPFVYHIADMWPESLLESGMISSGAMRDWIEAALHRWCNWVYGEAEAVTVLSPGFKQMLVDRGVPAHKVHVIYNWTDEDVFQPLDRDLHLAASFGLEKTFNVVYAGNLGAFQAIDTLLKAAALVRDLPRVRIVIAGTGQKEAQCKALAAELGLNNVVFMGRREYWQMPQINALADVLVVHLKDLPFFAATIPSKTQVNLACGRPVLMAVRGDSADIVNKAGAGLTCEPENPAAMAAAIRQFAEMPSERLQEMGKNGRQYYLQEMSLGEGARRMQEIFRAVALPGREPRGNAHV